MLKTLLLIGALFLSSSTFAGGAVYQSYYCTPFIGNGNGAEMVFFADMTMQLGHQDAQENWHLDPRVYRSPGAVPGLQVDAPWHSADGCTVNYQNDGFHFSCQGETWVGDCDLSEGGSGGAG